MAVCPRCRSTFEEVPLNGRCPNCDCNMFWNGAQDSGNWFPITLSLIAFAIAFLLSGWFLSGLLWAGIVLYLWSITWAYRDGENKGKPGPAVALFVALAVWPIGLLAWIIFS